MRVRHYREGAFHIVEIEVEAGLLDPFQFLDQVSVENTGEEIIVVHKWSRSHPAFRAFDEQYQDLMDRITKAMSVPVHFMTVLQ
jgi:hypothetical protein